MPNSKFLSLYRQADFRTRAVEDSEDMIIEGYFVVFDQPYIMGDWGEEYVARGAFDGCDMTDVIMQYDHCGRVFARTTNSTLGVGPDEIGLAMKARLGGTELGRQLYQEIDGGYTTKMSYGYQLRDDGLDVQVTEELDDGTVVVMQTVRGIAKLYDVSAVSIPANDATSISARSAADGAISAIKKERLAALRRAEQINRIKILAKI